MTGRCETKSLPKLTSQAARTGAINALAVLSDDTSMFAATDGGCVVRWDRRNPSCIQCILRVAVATRGCYVWQGEVSPFSGPPTAVDALLPHPYLRDMLGFQLADGTLGIVDAMAGSVLSHCKPWTQEITDPPASPLQEVLREGGQLPTIGRAPSRDEVDRFVRRRRPTWLGALYSRDAQWLAGGRPGTTGVELVRVERDCSSAAPVPPLPSSSAVVATSQHPRGHFVAVGMADNTVALFQPLSESGEDSALFERTCGEDHFIAGSADNEVREESRNDEALISDEEHLEAFAYSEGVAHDDEEDEKAELQALESAARRASSMNHGRKHASSTP